MKEEKVRDILRRIIRNVALADVLLVLICESAAVLLLCLMGEADARLTTWTVTYSIALASVITVSHLSR